LLGDSDERDRLGIEGLDQLGEVGQRPGQPVDLVDDDDVDPAGVDILQELLKGRAIEIAAGIGGVVIMLGEGPPALRGLTLYIGLAGIPLGIERIELQFQAMLGGFAGVDGAAQRFCRTSGHSDDRRSRPTCRQCRRLASDNRFRHRDVSNGTMPPRFCRWPLWDGQSP
jgi:hypothetical protein